MRGVALVTHGFVAQSFIHELAGKAGVDVLNFQLSLLDPAKVPTEVPDPVKAPKKKGKKDSAEKFTPKARAARLRAVLEEAAAKAGWGAPLSARRGRGIAIHEDSHAFYAVVVEVTLDGEGWFKVDRVIVAGDPGFLVNPRSAEAQVEGSVAFALSSAIYGEITVQAGKVVEGNFDSYRILRMDEMPEVEVHWVLNGDVWGGVGEPVVAAVAPALTNAIYDAGGPRIRSLPIKNHKILMRS
jgi:isoquinoline 1-oxidoreductase beta subunit